MGIVVFHGFDLGQANAIDQFNAIVTNVSRFVEVTLSALSVDIVFAEGKMTRSFTGPVMTGVILPSRMSATTNTAAMCIPLSDVCVACLGRALFPIRFIFFIELSLEPVGLGFVGFCLFILCVLDRAIR